MRVNKHLLTAVRRCRSLISGNTSGAEQASGLETYPNDRASGGVMPLEELECRTLLSASPFPADSFTDESPAVVQAGLLSTDPEDSLIAGDLDSDGFVGIGDLNIVLGNWNASVPPGNPAADISGDGFVGIDDLNTILGNWNNIATVGLSSGLALTGTLINTTDTDYFSINAGIGDDLLVSFAELGPNSIGMEVDVYAPNNTLVAMTSNDSAGNLSALNLNQAGTYTIVLSDTGSNNIYDYNLTATVVDSVIDAGNVALTSGSSVTETIDLGDIDTFTINADIGDDLLVSFAELGPNSIGMEIDVYGPNSFLVASTSNDSAANLSALNLNQAGTYTVVVRDTGADGSYDYNLTATVVDSVIDADDAALTSGQMVTETIGLGDIDTFTINAGIGDDLLVSFAELGPNSIGMEIDVYGPNSFLVAATSNDSAGNLSALNLAQTGVYTVVVRDTGADGSYDYNLTATVVNNVIDAGNVALTSGSSVTETIGLGDIDTFTINAGIGDDLFVSFAELGPNSIGMEIDVYGPNSFLVASTSNDSAGNLSALNLAQAGTYTIVVRDTGADGSYDYNLTATVVDSVIDAGDVALTSGQMVTETIGLGDIDTFTINAGIGDDLFVSFAELGPNSIGMEIDVYGPNSFLLTSASNDDTGNLSALNLAQAGTYTVVVRDTGADGSYDYNLTATVVDSVIDAGDVALTSGSTVTGAFVPGDIDTFTINASSGDDLMVSYAELGPNSIGMHIDIYDPNSILLTFARNDDSGTLQALNLSQSGTYTIVMRDSDSDGTYDYNLTATVSS